MAVSETRRTCEGEGLQARGIVTADRQVLSTALQRTGSSTDAATVACFQERVTNLDGESLPSETVGTPDAPGSGWYALMVATILWVSMAALDICA